MPRTEGSRRGGRSEILSVPQRAFVASATRMDQIPSLGARLGKPIINVEGGWQKTLWDCFDTIPEYRYAMTWVGNLLSRASLTIHQYKDGDWAEVTEGPAVDYLGALYGGDHSDMLRQYGIHLSVAGDAYLLGFENEFGRDEWLMAAASELTVSEDHDGNKEWKIDGEAFYNPLAIRTWRPHPRKRKYSDSPSRAAMPVLAEIDGYTKHIQAQLQSRLANNGVFLVPSEVSFAAPVEAGKPAAELTLMEQFIETARTAIAEPGSAAALVPIILQIPGEFIEKLQHLKFWDTLDEKAMTMRAESVRRLAMGLDMPPEVLLGTADMNHWGAWQVEEAAIKAHTEPLLDVIVDGLTSTYLRPLLISDGMSEEEAANFKICPDTSKLRLRPNRSKEAIELYDRNELSPATLRRENGFEESDAPTEEERKAWFVKKVAQGSTTPELVEAALVKEGTGLKVEKEPVPAPLQGQQERPIPTLKEHPKQEVPEEADPKTQKKVEGDYSVTEIAVAAASWAFVHRALERAGNRLRTKMGAKIAGVSAFETYLYYDAELPLDFLLQDAWEPARQFAQDNELDTQAYIANLEDFTRGLLTGRKALDAAELTAYLFPAE